MGSDYRHVFSPITIRGIDFKNRIVLAPPSPSLATQSGVVTHEFVNWFRQFARGGAAILYVGNASIDRSECKDEACQLELGTDECILPLSWYAEMGNSFNCHASLEINHNGKDTAFETIGHAPYSASSIVTASELTRAKRLGRAPIPSIEMTHEKIRETVEKYADSALRMKRAGMDICLLHGGHGNLISQFTSPLYNHRQDEYGGNTEKRARFAIEVCQAIRRKCGEDFVIEYRISADEIAEGGMHFDETLELIGLLKDHVDMFNVSAGLHSDFDMKYFRNWCQTYPMARGFNVHFAREVKRRYPEVLVDTVGSITSLDMAEEILGNGWADFVAMCRPLMADPDMPKKYAQNRPEDRRPCLRCNACTRSAFSPRPISCAVNPMSGMIIELPDGVVPRAAVRKKVAVVGGGPAGIQALLTLCERGHDVTLYEQADRLGGNLIGAAAPSFKLDCQDYLKWLVRQAERAPARVLLGTEATAEALAAERYDAMILAPGSAPVKPAVPGIELPHVSWVTDAELGKRPVGERLVIVGAGAAGLEAAIDFRRKGKHVTVVEMLEEEPSRAALFEGARSAATEILAIVHDEGIAVHYGCKLTEIRQEMVVCTQLADGSTETFAADTVLLASGMASRRAVVDQLRHCAPETEVYIVGDAKKVGTISDAVNQAFRAAVRI